MKKTKIISIALALASVAAMIVSPIAGVSAAPVTAAAPEAQSSAAIMDLSTPAAYMRSKMQILTGEGNGAFGFKKFDDGSQAMQIKFSESDGGIPAFHMMTKFLEGSKMTAEHKYVRVTYMTPDTVANKLAFVNNASHAELVLVSNTSESKGKFVRSDVVDITTAGILERLAKGIHCAFCYTSTDANSEIYIREIAFFTSREEAYSYYGEEIPAEQNYTEMNFGADTNVKFTAGDGFGQYFMNSAEGCVELTFEPNTVKATFGYLCMPKFQDPGSYDAKRLYVRVLYKAEQPAGTPDAEICFMNNASHKVSTLVSGVKDTNGEFVLSNAVLMDEALGTRFAVGGHNLLGVTNTASGSKYSIKSIYFFASKAEADALVLPSNLHEMTINGNDISKYQIVVDKNAGSTIKDAANTLAGKIKALTGFAIKVVTDDTAESEYEILVGTSARAKSTAVKGKTDAPDEYFAKLIDNTLVISANIEYAVKISADKYAASYLNPADGEKIEVTSAGDFNLNDGQIKPVNTWKPFANVASPEIFTEDFGADNGYFTEENGESKWNYKNGAMTANAKDLALSYIHVYEPDVAYSAKLMFTDKGADGDMGLLVRYTAADAWIKVGYDFAKGAWYIAEREGADFYTKTLASAPAAVSANTWYDLAVKADDKAVTLSVNGKEVLRASAAHVTPGRVGVYAENATVSIDDVSLTLLSGEGTIFKNVVHTKLPYDNYLEGGTVIETADGKLHYLQAEANYVSADKGATWSQEAAWCKTTKDYPDVLKLANGTYLSIELVRNQDGTHTYYSKISADEGATWVVAGKIHDGNPYGNAVNSNNMNDKLTQSPTTGRIFYCLSHDASRVKELDNKIFTQFYYSDDDGMTWNLFKNDSRNIPGNENAQYFSECKIIECADGTLRVYSSWNGYGYMAYAESKDNGETWGEVQLITDMPCARSSMAITRDVYADNNTTYYMVWVNSVNKDDIENGMPRSRLTLAKTTDGKSWTILGDVWRWEATAEKGGAPFAHIVDPAITVTADRIIVGTGISEQLGYQSTDHAYHQAQRQHLWAIDKESVQVGDKLYNFTDVTTKDASYEAFKFCVDNGLFNGTSATTMGPKVNVSRAMFATVLGRLNGADMTKYTTPTFKDVVAGQWYTNFVEWAAANNVITGYPGGIYGINDNITVEQACLILARYNGFKAGKDGKTMADFTDAGAVSSWAADGVKWAVESGVYEGAGALLNPTAPASRALMAEMMYNYTTIFGK